MEEPQGAGTLPNMQSVISEDEGSGLHGTLLQAVCCAGASHGP